VRDGNVGEEHVHQSGYTSSSGMDYLVTRAWIPRDGETLLTKEHYIFYVFGYKHPSNRVFAFLKYIPSKLKHIFPIRFLRQKWKLENVELSRPEKLYTAQNYQKFLETFRTNFPQYLYFTPYMNKEVLSIPHESIERVYLPNDCMQKLFRNNKRDKLQEEAVELVSLLSEESQVPLRDFGIHGSVGLNMHSQYSDIDLVVYGSQNFRKLEKKVDRLVDDGRLRYVFTKKIDSARKHRGRYQARRFVYNAVRKPEEITAEYGKWRYIPVKNVNFSCVVGDDSETMFRPAIYPIKDYKPDDSTSELADEQVPAKVLSMIGYYRNVARQGETVKVSGTLERVEDIETAKAYYQVVVGTATREKEYIEPLPR
jgi:predicted nucleotidyltransferase